MAHRRQRRRRNAGPRLASGPPLSHAIALASHPRLAVGRLPRPQEGIISSSRHCASPSWGGVDGIPARCGSSPAPIRTGWSPSSTRTRASAAPRPTGTARRWAPDPRRRADVDAVVVAAGNRAHREIGGEGPRPRPAAADGEAAGRLASTTPRTWCCTPGELGVPLMCGLLERYNPGILTAMSLLEEPLSRHRPPPLAVRRPHPQRRRAPTC